jgi:heme/copper-type cytochrome/quinol oxidase subunit 1
MPRRIQDYPYAYSGWHSVASLGHIIVLIGLVNYFMMLAHAAFFKRPLRPRGHGLPFITQRISALISDTYFAAVAGMSTQTIGIRPVREYIFARD